MKGRGVMKSIVLISLLSEVLDSLFLYLNIHFRGQQLEWYNFKISISDGHLVIQDGRHGVPFLFIFTINDTGKLTTGGWKSI